MELRNYQLDIIKKTIESSESTLIQLPTGSGKTIIAKFIAQELIQQQNKQVLFVAPKIILMKQTAETFKELNPQIVHGANKNEVKAPVLISTLQTASKRIDILKPDIIIIDEIHYGFNGKMIELLINSRPNCRVIGLSATPYDKKGKLLEGFRLILDHYNLEYMVRKKYLVPIKTFVLARIENLEDVPIIGGDYNLKELSKIVSNPQTILEIVISSKSYIDQHKKSIVFAVDIGHSELLAKAYREKGYNAVALHSKLPKYLIENYLADFKIGKIQLLISVSMLTTGFDVPDTELAIIARPTKSQNLYKQMVGRVLRLAHNKEEATLLDCGNVVENLGMPLDPIRELNSLQRNQRKNCCPECKSENIKLKVKDDSHSWICKDCGYKKDVKQGSYQCKMCQTLYAHNAEFEYKNNKVYLVCPKCPYPTLISEYRGNEKFLKIGKKYLSYNKAQKHIKQLKFKSEKEWKKFVRNVKEGKAYLRADIPLEPDSVYIKNGWINTREWLGLTETITNGDMKFKKACINEDLDGMLKYINIQSNEQVQIMNSLSSETLLSFLFIQDVSFQRKLLFRAVEFNMEHLFTSVIKTFDFSFMIDSTEEEKFNQFLRKYGSEASHKIINECSRAFTFGFRFNKLELLKLFNNAKNFEYSRDLVDTLTIKDFEEPLESLDSSDLFQLYEIIEFLTLSLETIFKLLPQKWDSLDITKLYESLILIGKDIQDVENDEEYDYYLLLQYYYFFNTAYEYRIPLFFKNVPKINSVNKNNFAIFENLVTETEKFNFAYKIVLNTLLNVSEEKNIKNTIFLKNEFEKLYN